MFFRNRLYINGPPQKIADKGKSAERDRKAKENVCWSTFSMTITNELPT